MESGVYGAYSDECGQSVPIDSGQYRSARLLLADSSLDYLKVESVGQRAGFKSRSAFFEAFEKATGQTPAAYRKERSRD